MYKANTEKCQLATAKYNCQHPSCITILFHIHLRALPYYFIVRKKENGIVKLKQ
jgi:hypothetical protein